MANDKILYHVQDKIALITLNRPDQRNAQDLVRHARTEITSMIEKAGMIADGKNVQVGSPLVEKASVEAKVISQGKGKKVNILKFKRRKHSMKQQGHRQLFTEIQIGKIKA